MKLKYYLRGLGIGILVTAVIMGVTQGSRKETLSDREIRERAAALGMVEPGNSLADLEEAVPSEAPKEEQTETVTETPAVSETPEVSEEGKEEQTPEATETPEAEATKAPSKTPAPTQAPAEAEKAPAADEQYYTLEIQAGDSSYQVAYRLEQAHLVEDAGEFDSYLCSKGYDRKLRTGSYEIPETATENEIAEILGGR